MSSKVVKNYLYNFLYQIAALIIPLITAPYLSRILGVDGTGTYSYYYSIVYYFSMFVLLGTSNYGNRSIARCLGNPERITTTLDEIYTLQFMCGLVVTSLYLFYVFVISSNPILCFGFLPFILSSMFDITWYYFGQENFRIVVLRNISIKIVTTILIFLIVKTREDLLKYVLIMSIGYFLSQFIIWFILMKKHEYTFPGFNNIIKHLKPNLILFIPFISVSIYRYMDKIMVGKLTAITEVGYYENAEKIVSLLLSFITAIGTVMLPRMSALYASGSKSEIRDMLIKSTVTMSFMASAVAFGVASISDRLIVWYYSSQFAGSVPILNILCITIPFICYANIIRMQILIPKGNDKIYVSSTVFGAVVNIIFNVFLIPRFGGIGAAVGTVIAEFSVMLFQYVAIRKDNPIQGAKRVIAFFWVNGFVMYVVTVLSGSYLPKGFVGMITQVVVGIITYGVGVFIYYLSTKDPIVSDMISVIKRR